MSLPDFAKLERTWEDHKIHDANSLYSNQETLAFWRTNQAYAIKMCIEAVARLMTSADVKVG
ncbi:MAG: hypothetical protein RR479_01600 [Acinetobacter sp.]